MSLIRINNLTMSFGGQNVFNSLTAQINDRERIGLVGPNGVGKTTLLRLIIRELEPLDGHVAAIPGLKIGYLPQYQDYPAGQTVFNEVYAGLGELREITSEMRILEAAIREAEKNRTDDVESLAMRYAELVDQYEILGGSTSESKIAELLTGLGVPERIWQSEMSSISGGERNLVGLARILIGNHDLMLLDEPGNHLDFSGLDWLENYLNACQKAFIIVSHNRYSLDRVCSRIWELERGLLEVYTGNYSDYRALKLSSQLARDKEYHRAQKEIKRLNFNIQRLKAWGSVYDNPKLSRTAKIFEKRVEQLEQVEKPSGDGKKMRFRFLTKPPRGRIALETNDYRKQFDNGSVLLDHVNFLIVQGERVALVGDNGTGKTSFIRDVIEKGDWESKSLRIGKSVKIGYFSQLGENLDPGITVVENAMRLTGMLRGNAADLLHRFLFTRDDLDKKTRVLSGGETARLQLAVLFVSGADMLLLDEPTNHLDIASREAVEDAFEEFPGTMVVISHDRYFLDKLADRVLHFVPPAISEYEGNFSEFWRKHKKKLAELRSKSAHSRLRRFTEEEYKQRSMKDDKQKRKRIKFDPQRFRELETEIHRLEDLRPSIEAELQELEAKGKETRANRRRLRLQDIDENLEELYSEWVTLGEKKKKWR